MPLILDHVSYVYSEKTAYEKKALDEVTLALHDGEFTCIIGHTGSGKSTLALHLNGLLKATSGTIYFDGQDIYEKGYRLKDLRQQVGIVFQYPEHQLFETTVYEDVCFGPRSQGLSEKEVALRAYEALERVHFPKEMVEHSPFELSGGQKRRAAIAGVIAMRPKVLVLDEPTAGLDPGGRDEILSLVQEMHARDGITVVLVSHSMDDVAKLAERVIVMDQGRVFLDGAPEDVFSYANAPALIELGLGVPKVTEIALALRERGVPLRDGIIRLEDAREEILRCYVS